MAFLTLLENSHKVLVVEFLPLNFQIIFLVLKQNFPKNCQLLLPDTHLRKYVQALQFY